MKAFDDNGLTFFQNRRLFIKITVTCDEIEAGQVDFLALVEVVNLLIEKGHVDGPQRFEVITAVGILRRIFAIIEIIV